VCCFKSFQSDELQSAIYLPSSTIGWRLSRRRLGDHSHFEAISCGSFSSYVNPAMVLDHRGGPGVVVINAENSVTSEEAICSSRLGLVGLGLVQFFC
jgi:hypothetical protein